MGGKASLILVMGVAYLLLIFQTQTGNISTHALDNYLDNYSKTISHQIAVSGMNIAAAKLYSNISWRGPLTNVSLNGGSFDIAFGGSGDTLIVYSIADFDGTPDTVIAYFSGTNELTKYAWYTAHENGVAWTPGDSIFGPIHTNGTLNHQNKSTIVFSGKVTAGKGIKPPPKRSKTQFLGGYEVGVYNTEVVDMGDISTTAATGGFDFVSGGDLLKIIFNADGTVDMYHDTTLIYDDELLGNIAPNGVIYTDGDLEVSGGGNVDTPAGGITIGANGTITFRDEVKYLDNPRTNPGSDDLLAFVAMDDLILDNSSKADWDLQCVLMSVSGSIAATDMNKNGTFTYYGSLYQSVRGNAKLFQSMNKRYYHDERLFDVTPPAYPGMSNLILLAWWE